MARTVVESIDQVTAWVQEHICDHFRLKSPADQHSAVGDVTLVTPRAYSMYLPQTDLDGSDDTVHPSVLVQLLPSKDDPHVQREMQIRLSFTTYSIGTQEGELYIPTDRPSDPDAGEVSGTFKKLEPEQWQEPPYRRNEEGWRDAWNMIDRALSEIEGSKQIGPFRLDRTKGVEFGPYASDDDPIWTYYPYWGGWVTFSITGETPRLNWEYYQDL